MNVHLPKVLFYGQTRSNEPNTNGSERISDGIDFKPHGMGLDIKKKKKVQYLKRPDWTLFSMAQVLAHLQPDIDGQWVEFRLGQLCSWTRSQLVLIGIAEKGVKEMKIILY